MSFGVSISDIAMVVDLAWSTLDGARKACGEHDELTKEISSLHLTLEHLRSEVEDPDSLINKHRGGRRKDLNNHISGCRRHLRRINSVLTKHNTLQNGSGSMWQRIQFGTAGVKDVSKSQLKLSTYTTAITLTLSLISLGSQGRVEKELSHQRGEAKGLRASINLLLAKQTAVSREGTRDGSLRSISHDDRTFWRNFRQELADEGFKSSVLNTHKTLIIDYLKELGDRKMLDEETLRIPPPTSEGPAAEQVELEHASSHRAYRQPTVEDCDTLSIDNLSVHELHQEEVSQEGSNLPEHDERTQKAAVEESDKMPSESQYQAHVPLPTDSSSLQRTYEDTPVGYTVAPHILELAEKIQHLEEINRQQHVLLRSINTDHASSPVIRLIPDAAAREPTNTEIGGPIERGEKSKAATDCPATCDPNKPLGLSSDEYLDILRNNDELEDGSLSIIRSGAFTRLGEDEKKLMIIFEDPDGHKFSFPYYMVKMWRGMQYAVEHASCRGQHAEQVELGNYILTDADGVRIVPEFWHDIIEPGQTVIMCMRPPQESQRAPDSSAPEPCDCNECMPSAPSSTIPFSTSYGWQNPSGGYYSAPHPTKRASSTVYHGWQRKSWERDSPPSSPKQKASLSLLLFAPRRKSKQTAPAYIPLPQQAARSTRKRQKQSASPPRSAQPLDWGMYERQQTPRPSRKKQKRAPPPPRPVTPTPPPPDWWLYERQRRRPAGYERGRSPPAHPPSYDIEPVYSRSIAAYPEVSYDGGPIFELE